MPKYTERLINMKKSVIGQQKIKNLFAKSLAADRLGHCYTLVGDEGMGKSTLSSYLAKMIVCEHGSACGVCRACVMADAGTHPDIEYILREEDKKSIGVEVMRRMIENIYVRPYSSPKKVIVINRFDTALPPAQNAVLKVLEEPPEYVVFLLSVSSENNMLDTVKSRSAIIRMEPYTKEEIKQFLRENTEANEAEIDFISEYAEGNIGKGKLLAENQGFARLRKDVFEALFEAVEKRNVIPFSDLTKKDKDKKDRDIKQMLECALSFFRDMLMYKTGQEAMAVNRDYADRIKAAAGKIKTQRILNVMQDIMEADANLQRNINYNLAVSSVVFGSLEEIND